MTTPQVGEYDLRNLRYGLNTRDRPQDLAPGEARQSNNVWYYRGLAQPVGTARVLSYRPQQAAVMLNGFDQHFSCRIGTGTFLSLKADAAPYASNKSTLAVYANTSGIKAQQVLAIKTPAGSATPTTYTAGNFDWLLQLVSATNGKLALDFRWEDAGGTMRQVITTGLFTPGLGYIFSVTMDKTAGDVGIAGVLVDISDPNAPALAVIGTATLALGAGSGNVFPKDRAGHFLVGAWRKQYPLRPSELVSVNANFQGKIQEARFYDGIPIVGIADAGQATTSTSLLKVCYPLTNKGPVLFPDIFGVAPPLQLQPRDAQWITSPFTGLEFDGITDFIRVPDAFRYRKPTPNTNGEYPQLDKPIIHWKGQVEALINGATLLHSAHNSKTQMTTDAGLPATAGAAPWIPFNGSSYVVDGGTGGYNPPRAQWQLQVAENPAAAGTFQFRVIFWFYRTSGPHGANWDAVSLVSTLGGSGVAINTTYDVVASCDYTNGDIKLYINGSTAAGSGATVAHGISNMLPLNTEDDPEGAAANYNIVIAAPIRQTMLGGGDPSNPNDSNLTFNFSSQGITSSAAAYVQVDRIELLDGAITDYLANALGLAELDRDKVRSLGATVLSAWNFSEARGGVVQDIGILANHLYFRHDARHKRGRSIILTTVKGKIHAIFVYTYPSDDGSGETRKLLALHDGGVEVLNEQTNRLNDFAEGFRNDLDLQPSFVKHQDSLLIAAGGPIFRLWKNRLWKAGIDPPVGPFPWGLTNQNQKKAALASGRYTGYFVYYNSFLNIESPRSDPIYINVRARRADLALGEGIESNQFPPTSGESGEKEGAWDFEGKKKRFLRVAHWVEPPETAPGAGGNEAEYRRWKITDKQGNKQPGIKEIDDVKASELRKIANNAIPRVRVIETPEGRLIIEGRYLGANAKLRFDDPATGEPVATELGGTAWNGIKATNIVGLGWTSDIPLPQGEGDDQITHVRFYRTLRDGIDAHLVLELPIGKRVAHDKKRDAENFDQILDLDVGGPPLEARYIVEQFGRLMAWGDPLNPGNLYVSEIGAPHYFLPTAIVKLGDGDTNRIVAVGRTQNQLIVQKRNTLIVLHEPRNPQMPFYPETRSHSVGGDSPFGIVNSGDRLYWPAELGFHNFGGDEPRLFSDVIQPTWAAIPGNLRDRIVCFHWRRFEVMGWAVPSGLSFAADGTTPINDSVILWFYGVSSPDGRTRGFSMLTGLNCRAFFTIQNADEEEELWFIDQFGFPYRFDVASLDFGVGSHATGLVTKSGTLAGTPTSTTLSLPQMPLATIPEGYLGLPVTVRRTSTGTRETRFIVADNKASPSIVTVDHAFSFTPVAGDTYFIGSIEMHWISGSLYPFSSSLLGKWLRTIIEQTVQNTAGEYELHADAALGTLVERPALVKNVANTKANPEVTTEFRGIVFELGIAARGINLPVEIGQLTMVLDGPARSERKSHRL